MPKVKFNLDYVGPIFTTIFWIILLKIFTLISNFLYYFQKGNKSTSIAFPYRIFSIYFKFFFTSTNTIKSTN